MAHAVNPYGDGRCRVYPRGDLTRYGLGYSGERPERRG